jgi:hypothetical protein
MYYVLVRMEDGLYVARPGMERSYTTDLVEALKFTSVKDAERNRCVESERVESLYDILNCGR